MCGATNGFRPLLCVRDSDKEAVDDMRAPTYSEEEQKGTEQTRNKDEKYSDSEVRKFLTLASCPSVTFASLKYEESA